MTIYLLSREKFRKAIQFMRPYDVIGIIYCIYIYVNGYQCRCDNILFCFSNKYTNVSVFNGELL